MQCRWRYFGESERQPCDNLHHYFKKGTINTDHGIDIGHPGDFAALEYAQALYLLAFDFWPGKDRPTLSKLEYKRNAGKTMVSGWDLSPHRLRGTYLGGMPLCELWAKHNEPMTCPKWPDWASRFDSDPEKRYTQAVESERNAMR